MRAVTVHALPTGSCRHPEAMTLQGGRWRAVEFPAVATLILHPQAGPILFDTGYDPAFLQATQPFPERLYRWATPVQLGASAAEGCRALGIDPAEVRHVVLSHFHADHVAGAHAFPQATLHCARAGLEAAWRGSRFFATRRGLLRALIPADIDRRARYFENGRRVGLSADLQPFTEAVDVLGDGALLAVELPGHCPGHWGLLVEDARHGPHFLVADAAWSCRAIAENRPPPRLTTHLLGDTRATRHTLARLHDLSSRNPDIRLTPCHCAQGWALSGA